MRKFRFSLQAVLTVRQRQEQVALENYARALAEFQVTTQKTELADRQLTRAWGAMRREVTGGTTVEQFAWSQEYCHSMERELDKCHRELDTHRKRLEAQRQKVLSARRDREAVEKFEEAQRKKHDYEVRRQEEKAVEDLINGRQQVSGGLQPRPWDNPR